MKADGCAVEEAGEGFGVGAESEGAARFLSVAVCTTRCGQDTASACHEGQQEGSAACPVLAGAVFGNGGKELSSSGWWEESRTRGSERSST